MFHMNMYNREDKSTCIDLVLKKTGKPAFAKGFKIVIVADGVHLKPLAEKNFKALFPPNTNPNYTPLKIASIAEMEEMVKDLLGYRMKFGMYMIQTVQSADFIAKHKTIFVIPNYIYLHAEEATRVPHYRIR